ncbi:MAG: VCBS repeat-containing protein [Polyangiaceae bacterium]
MDSTGLLAGDANGDSTPELIYVSGGAVVAASPQGVELWRTQAVGVTTLLAIADLDNDGGNEIVGYSSRQVFVLNGKTGELEWTEPDGEMGVIGGVRIGDLNGDGKLEIVIRECGCCGVASGNPGLVYSFVSALATPAKLWSLPPTNGCGDGNGALTVVDLDGVLPPELLVAAPSSFSVMNGTDGAVLASVSVPNNLIQVSQCFPANLDKVPGNELVCMLDYPSATGHVALALHYDASAKQLTALWSTALSTADTGDIFYVDPLVDLDGDGSLELVVSVSDGGAWATQVFNPATGSLLATLPNRKLVGTAKLSAGKESMLLTGAQGAVTAWRFDPQGAPKLSLQWAIQNVRTMSYPDASRMRASGPGTWSRVAALDVSGDGAGELIVVSSELAPGSGGSITAYSADKSPPTKVKSVPLPPGVDVQQGWLVNALPVTLAVERNDGFLLTFDANLTSIGNGSGDPGIRTGGFYASGGWRDLQKGPVASKLDATGRDALLAVDSRGALLRLDASTASLASPPAVAWGRTHTFAPAIVQSLLGGQPGVVALSQQEPVVEPPEYSLMALGSDGVELWTHPLPGTPLNDVLVGNADGDAVPDVAVAWGDPSDTKVRTRMVSGASGATFWDATPVTSGCGYQQAGFSLADWNGDGRDDVIHQLSATRIISGASGVEIATGGPPDCYFMPSLFDVDSDGVDEITLHGGYTHAQTLPHSLGPPMWTGSPDDNPYPYAAIATCPGGAVVAEGSWQKPARLKLSTVSSGKTQSVVLAGGEAFASESEASAKGKALAQLTSTSVHQNLTGTGSPSAIVGSADGHLYAVDPCTGSLQFYLSFPAAVGAIIFADTDGDGLDEVIVAVADGYLYGLKQPPLSAPSYIWDTDPEHGITGADVDTVETKSSLFGAWGTVDGATSYQVAAVKYDLSGFVSKPEWKDVGTKTEVELSDLQLESGTKYRLAVRAVLGGKNSPDALSDGVQVQFPPDAGDAGDGGDAGTDASDASVSDGAPDANAPAKPGEILSGRACTCESPGHARGGMRDAAIAAVVALGTAVRRRRDRSTR